ncbi:hypothetical protein KI688_001147 [Linnemannia hyalina]|uniref:HCP-like protein n=1 Tax=Linnemannia hyalina TaxID=64524 RepID=A0A9P7Y5G3_9FUNG|nr:hypothetical protein KI688_001147 [Linnemannia hyalina]
MEDDSIKLQAVRAVSKDNLDAPPSSAPGAIVHLETYEDPNTKKPFILWGDIEQAFENVIHVRFKSRIVPYLKGSDFMPIAAFPDAVLDVVVRDPVPSPGAATGTATLRSLVQETPPVIPQKKEEPATPTNTAANTVRRNPQYGLVEAALENYNHMEDPAKGPKLRGPQEIPDETLPPSSIKPNTPNSLARAPQDSAGNNDITETMMNARLGVTQAQVALADLYRLGQGVHQSYQEAMYWYMKAAEQGDPVGQRRVGALHDHGLGVLRDSQTALTWFLRAAEQGDAPSQRNIGVLYHSGNGVPKDYPQAMEWYSKAAEQGDAAAQYALGLMYQCGQGVSPNISRALVWYDKAAKQGHGQAQCNLGFLYGNGEGVTQDYVTALDWYLKAASQNHVVAFYNIARYYYRGRCSLQQSTMATEGLKRAASKGDPDAARYLQELDRLVQAEQ